MNSASLNSFSKKPFRFVISFRREQKSLLSSGELQKCGGQPLFSVPRLDAWLPQ
jgi:hypothetical protein